MGDLILREIAGQIAGRVRTSDVVARYGGEEFAIIYPETTLEPAALALERIRADVSKTQHKIDPELSRTLAVTISCGIVPFSDASKQVLLKQADDALYRAKKGGKNRVVVAKP